MSMALSILKIVDGINSYVRYWKSCQFIDEISNNDWRIDKFIDEYFALINNIDNKTVYISLKWRINK